MIENQPSDLQWYDPDSSTDSVGAVIFEGSDEFADRTPRKLTPEEVKQMRLRPPPPASPQDHAA